MLLQEGTKGLRPIWWERRRIRRVLTFVISAGSCEALARTSHSRGLVHSRLDTFPSSLALLYYRRTEYLT